MDKRRGGVGRGAVEPQVVRAPVVVGRANEEKLPSRGEPDQEVMTRQEAAAYLRLSLRTMDRLPIPRVKLGHRTVRFLRADLDAYLAQHREAA